MVLAVTIESLRTPGASVGSPGVSAWLMGEPQRMAAITLGCLVTAVQLAAGARPIALFWSLVVVVVGSLVTTPCRLTQISRDPRARRRP